MNKGCGDIIYQTCGEEGFLCDECKSQELSFPNRELDEMECFYCEHKFQEKDFGSSCKGCGYMLLPEEYTEEFKEKCKKERMEQETSKKDSEVNSHLRKQGETSAVGSCTHNGVLDKRGETCPSNNPNRENSEVKEKKIDGKTWERMAGY